MSYERNFLYPKVVNTFAFGWGRLALTVAPDTNGAMRFSGGVVDLTKGQGHSGTTIPGLKKSSS